MWSPPHLLDQDWLLPGAQEGMRDTGSRPAEPLDGPRASCFIFNALWCLAISPFM